jgi:type IV secretory pathway TrbF-like protein
MSLFQRFLTSSEKNQANPFVFGEAGRREWNDRYDNMRQSIQRWQWISFGFLGLTFLLLGGFLYLASQSRIEPYVIDVNQGMPIHLQSLNPNDTRSLQVVNYVLNQFIQNARSVLGDREAEKALLKRVYAYSANSSLSVLASFYQTRNPFDISQQKTITVQIVNSMPLTRHTWQITWDELARNRDSGDIIESHRYMATLSYAFGKVNSHFLEDNPFGLYVTDIAWAENQTHALT